MSEESKQVFSNLMTLSEKLELNLREYGFTELLAMQYEKLTMKELIYYNTDKKIWWNWMSRERSTRNKRKVKWLKNQMFMTQEMTWGFSLFEEALLVFKAWDMKVKWFTKVVTAIQNAIRSYHVMHVEEKRDTT